MSKVMIKFWNDILEEYWTDEDVKAGDLMIDRFGDVGTVFEGRWIYQGDAEPHYYKDGERIG